MRLRFSAEAQEHIASIYSYIGDRSPFGNAAERLIEFPRMGRTGLVEGTHEWVVRGLPYIIVYEIGTADPDEIVILGVFHGARDREPE